MALHFLRACKCLKDKWLSFPTVEDGPKPRKRRKAKRMPAGPKIKARQNATSAQIQECMRRWLPKKERSSWYLGSGAGTCIDVAKWRVNLKALLAGPDHKCDLESKQPGDRNRYFSATVEPGQDQSRHERYEAILACIREGGEPC